VSFLDLNFDWPNQIVWLHRVRLRAQMMLRSVFSRDLVQLNRVAHDGHGVLAILIMLLMLCANKGRHYFSFINIG
jgi:hypothetical protein